MNPNGYPPFAIVFGILTAFCLFWSAWRTRSDGQRLKWVAPSGAQTWLDAMAAPIRDIREALRYRAFRSLTFGVLLQYTAFGVSDALGLYMATYFWGISTDLLFVWGIGMFTGMYLGFDFWRRVGSRLEKRQIYVIGSLGYMAAYITPYVLKAGGLWPNSESALYLPMYIGLTGLVAHFFSAGPTIMTGSMLGDITDLDELETGKRREGVIFGAESLAYKMFSGFGPVLAGLVVDFSGITPDSAASDVPKSAVVALGLGQGVTSFVLFVVSLVFLSGYDLDLKRHRGVLTRLRESHAGKLARAAEP
jgi:Na+/melibiose symporter-like transporter